MYFACISINDSTDERHVSRHCSKWMISVATYIHAIATAVVHTYVYYVQYLTRSMM